MINVLLLHRLTASVPDEKWTVSRGIFAALAAAAKERAGVGPEIVFSFDDGNASDRELALPLLKANGLKAIFFIITGQLGRPGFLSAAGVRELQAAGMEIGSHTHSHRPLSQLPPGQVEEELRRSRTVLEDLLSVRIAKLSLPFGRYDRPALAAARRAGYDYIYSSIPGLNPAPLPATGLIKRNAVISRTGAAGIAALLAPSPATRAAWRLGYEAKGLLRRFLPPAASCRGRDETV